MLYAVENESYYPTLQLLKSKNRLGFFKILSGGGLEMYIFALSVIRVSLDLLLKGITK